MADRYGAVDLLQTGRHKGEPPGMLAGRFPGGLPIPRARTGLPQIYLAAFALGLGHQPADHPVVQAGVGKVVLRVGDAHSSIVSHHQYAAISLFQQRA